MKKVSYFKVETKLIFHFPSFPDPCCVAVLAGEYIITYTFQFNILDDSIEKKKSIQEHDVTNLRSRTLISEQN